MGSIIGGTGALFSYQELENLILFLSGSQRPQESDDQFIWRMAMHDSMVPLLQQKFPSYALIGVPEQVSKFLPV